LKKNSLLNHFTFHFGIYFTSTIISKIIPFLLLPIITKILIPAEYGKWSVFSSILAFTVPFAGLMMRYHIARSYYKLSREKIGELLSNVIFITLISSICIFLLSVIFSLFYKGFFMDYRIYLIPLLAFLTCISEYFTTILRYEKKPILYAVFELSGTLILWIIAVALIISDIMKWEGMLAGSVLSAFLITVFSLMYFKKNGFLIFKFSKEAVESALKIGIPLLPHAAAASVIAMSDRLILVKMTTTEIVGIYSVGYALGMTVNIFIEAFNKNWGPWIYEKLTDTSEETKILIVKNTYIFIAVLTAAFIAVCAGGNLYITFFIDIKYHAAVPILYWAALSAFFRGLYIAIFPYMTHLGITYIYSVITVTSGIINIILTVILVRYFGMIGAAQATAAAFFLMFFLLFIFSNSRFPMPWLFFLKRIK